MESINSSDITNKNFGSVFRGYDKSQVDNFLKILSKEFEILENKIAHLKERLLFFESHPWKTDLKNYLILQKHLFYFQYDPLYFGCLFYWRYFCNCKVT